MDLWGEIGGAAGKVFSALEGESDPVSLGVVKKKSKLTDDLLYLALGWLAREDKVYLDRDKATIRVKLK